MGMNDDALRVLLAEELLNEQSVLVNEYSFYLGETHTRVRVRIHFDAYRDHDQYRFELSHYIRTPEQAGAYVPSSPRAGSEAAALGRAIDSLTQQYNYAVERGHAPSEKWLVRASG